jgi:transcriptional regulator with XRE-family HTH domain
MVQPGFPTNNELWIARKKAGLGQKVVARLLGYRSTSPISEYETGKMLPSLRTAMKLALVYNASIPELYPVLYQALAEEIETRRRRFPRVVTPSSYATQSTQSNLSGRSRDALPRH